MDEQVKNSSFSSKAFVEQIILKGANHYICPICSGKDFTVVDDVGTLLVSKNLTSLQIGRHIPCAIMVCTNCGHLDLFSIGVLGFLKEVKKDG